VARLIHGLDPPGDFNFRHFRMRHMAAELLRTVRTDSTLLGRTAPDFELETTTGETLRLGDLRGAPVLLHFASYTCPVTRGGVSSMNELHRHYGDRVRFVDVLVRQAHPGECRGAYRSYEEKLEDARAYAEEERIAWPVVVDDLDGTVQRAYGGLAAAVFLLDSEGKMAFYGIWGQAPALRAAIDELLARGGTGVPAGRGIDRVPHLGPAIVAGQGGPARGGWVALRDLELGFPGAFVLMTVGSLARPLLGPFVLRTTPIPVAGRAALLAGLAGGLLAGARVVRRRH
jgi:thiol-disulfide isomerase/thioredoxin